MNAPPALPKRFIAQPSSTRLPPARAATLVGRCTSGRIQKSRGNHHGGREAGATRVDHGRGGGEGPAEAEELVRLRAAGVEGPLEELREGARVVPPDRVAARAFVRSRRASSPHRPRAGAGISREARVRRRAGAGPARRPTEAMADGRAPPDAPRD